MISALERSLIHTDELMDTHTSLQTYTRDYGHIPRNSVEMSDLTVSLNVILSIYHLQLGRITRISVSAGQSRQFVVKLCIQNNRKQSLS